MDNLTSLIKSVLGLSHDKFRIKDNNDRYVLVHQLGRYGTEHNELRGTIIDIKTKSIVTGMSSRIIECTQAEIKEDLSENVVLLHLDNYSDRKVPQRNTINDLINPVKTLSNVKLPLNELEMSYSIEGTNIFIWLDHNGNVMISSYSSLDVVASRSSYGESYPYFEYLNINKINLATMFRPNKLSRVVHKFIIQYPELALCCRRNAAGNIVYKGSIVQNLRVFEDKTKEIDDIPVPYEEFLPNVTSHLDKLVSSEFPTVLIPEKDLSLDKINDFLSYGYYDRSMVSSINSHTGTGEIVELFHHKTGRTYRVKSPSWLWRFGMQRFANVEQNMYFMFSFAKDLKIYNTAHFPHHRYQNDSELKRKAEEGIPIVSLSEEGDFIDINMHIGRVYNIMLCLLLSTPINKQRTVIYGMSKYLSDCKKAAEEFLILYNQHLDSSNEFLSKLVNDAINIVHDAKKRTLDENNTVTIADITEEIYRLHGVRTYSLLSELNKYNNKVVNKKSIV